jgi:hypothetical protein
MNDDLMFDLAIVFFGVLVAPLLLAIAASWKT